ncbi:hypothetical protein ACFQ3Z_45700 [Streptomyces nogalater]
MPDDLYQRYQAAHRAYQTHAASCDDCTRDTPDAGTDSGCSTRSPGSRTPTSPDSNSAEGD